jgi:hypothetical protein
VDAGLLVEVAQRLQAEGRWEGARLLGMPARGKWWPLTRNSGGVSDALGSVWGFTSFCVCVELIYIGVFSLHAFP